MMLVAFLLNIVDKLDNDHPFYIVLNFMGATLACIASCIIMYAPFIILEGTWALISGWGIYDYFNRMKANKVKVYFKGGEGIKKPLDYNGNEIKVGDILTHSYFYDGNDKFFAEHYPNMTASEIYDLKHKPSVIVKWNDKGFYYGEGIDGDNKQYMHDFKFKETKIVK